VRQLPIACTLDATAAQQRLKQWRRLGERAMLTVNLAGRSLAVAYDPPALAELQGLVRAEQTCCAFLDWSIEERAEQVVLMISADENGEPELQRLADLFGDSG
jgi:hypothetical protein